MNTIVERYAVFGNPIGHSKSPFIHGRFAAQTGQNMQYEAILAPLDGFADTWQRFVEEGGRGGNVTVPFKEQAFALCQQLSVRAAQAGAVNTLYVNDQGELCGDNTDGIGLVADLLRLDALLEDANVLVLGAGGASRGVIGPLLDAGVATIHIANRTEEKAKLIAAMFDTRVSSSGYADIPKQRWHIIINATSSGLSAERPPLHEQHLEYCQLAYDMLYGKEPTPFLVWCDKSGVPQVADGLGMLVSQAAAAFAIWRGVTPQVAPVLEELRSALA